MHILVNSEIVEFAYIDGTVVVIEGKIVFIVPVPTSIPCFFIVPHTFFLNLINILCDSIFIKHLNAVERFM